MDIFPGFNSRKCTDGLKKKKTLLISASAQSDCFLHLLQGLAHVLFKNNSVVWLGFKITGVLVAVFQVEAVTDGQHSEAELQAATGGPLHGAEESQPDSESGAL